MILALPVALSDSHRRVCRWPWVTWSVALLVVVINAIWLIPPPGAAAEWWITWLSWNTQWQLFAASPAEGELFRVWQLWTSALVYGEAWHAALHLLWWLIFASALERRLGHGRCLLTMVLLQPLAPALMWWFERPIVAPGLAPLLCVAAGASFSFLPFARLHVRFYYYAVVVLGRAHLPLLLRHVVPVLLLSEALRLAFGGWRAGFDSIGDLVAQGLGMVLMAIVGMIAVPRLAALGSGEASDEAHS